MTIIKGAGALDALNQEQGGGGSAEFTSLRSGTTLKVRAKGLSDLAKYYNYGIFNVVNSFIPAKPAKRNARGFVESDPSPWDKAAQYHQDLANKARDGGDKVTEDKEKANARLYRGSEKYIVGFHDLTSGKDIVVDLTRNQAQIVFAELKRRAKRLDSLAFELSKQGESTSTTVSLSPVIDFDEDLSDTERKNFEESTGKEFDDSLFDNVLYEADEDEQVKHLIKADFNIAAIGLERPTQGGAEGNPVDNTQVAEEDMPF